VDFKHRFTHKDLGGFPPFPPMGRWVKTHTLNIPFDPGEVINYTLDDE
jgi:hypothetical protein